MGVFTEVAERFHGLSGPSVRELSPTLNDMVLAASKAMDLLEGKPFRTGMKVAVLAGSIAKLMGLPSREVSSIVYAALLHDIGLAGITSDVFPHLPPGTTEKQIFQMHALLNARVIGTPHERPFSGDLSHLLSQHPLVAKSFIQALNLSEDVTDIVAAHHELCDGSGYPHGLSMEQIPLGARILALADVAEGVMAEVTTGLTTRRQALDSFLDIKTIDKFDPEVVATFKQLIDEHEDFLKGLFSLEVENMLRCLLPQRSKPLTGQELFNVVRALGGLSDSILALYKSERSYNVAMTAMRLAASLGIYREQCGELAIAAALMDIGHLGTPIGLLLKPGPLTADERAIMQDHPVMTREVLKGLPGFHNIVLWCSEHHERLNGKGYPGNKKGYEISIGGRILALADVFDALTNRRPHRSHSMAAMDAIPVIGQGRMTLYDTQLVTQLRRVVLETELVVH